MKENFLSSKRQVSIAKNSSSKIKYNSHYSRTKAVKKQLQDKTGQLDSEIKHQMLVQIAQKLCRNFKCCFYYFYIACNRFKYTRNSCSLQHEKAVPCFNHTEKLFFVRHSSEYETSDSDRKVNRNL